MDARAKFPDLSYADLYGEAMFLYGDLLKAHRSNDMAVMEAYGFFMEPTPEHPSKWYSPSKRWQLDENVSGTDCKKQQLKVSIYVVSRSTKCYQTATGTATRPATSYNIYKIKINA